MTGEARTTLPTPDLIILRGGAFTYLNLQFKPSNPAVETLSAGQYPFEVYDLHFFKVVMEESSEIIN